MSKCSFMGCGRPSWSLEVQGTANLWWQSNPDLKSEADGLNAILVGPSTTRDRISWNGVIQVLVFNGCFGMRI